MYKTSMTDSQWQVIACLLNDQRKRKYGLRSIINALLYLVNAGCQWRLLPRCFPPYQLCYYYFRKWAQDGTLKALSFALGVCFRSKRGRKPLPTLAVIDSQSVKSSEWGLSETGYDGNKKVKGRKRHIAVDTLGLLLCCVVTAANAHDSWPARTLLERLWLAGYAMIKTIVADQAYAGSFALWSQQTFGWAVDIAKTLKEKGFQVMPKRWIVERTISWFNWRRRLAKDYEASTQSSEAMLYLANIYYVIKKF